MDHHILEQVGTASFVGRRSGPYERMSGFAGQPKDGSFSSFDLEDLWEYGNNSDDGNADLGPAQTPKKERKKHHVEAAP